ncbi:uncharacterized protein LOC110913386 [Helianthus annuus]|uniref:uncharacterized protein LOC110913386 n=1 Tax=Helianthus annuus TaxID=4232 RepID=UPI000B9039FB|nr:uncharacterized protein LOC110913386 [Helianthus annuus]
MNYLSLNVWGMGSVSKSGWVSGLRKEYKINFIAIQESQVEEVRFDFAANFWGDSNFSLESVGATGRSRGLVCMWDPKVFRVQGVTKNRNFLLLNGIILGNNQPVNVINIYAPHRAGDKKRFGIVWRSGLVEYSMKGRRFTFLAPNSNKLSKIDRVLVCKDFFGASPEACLRALPRLHSDHCPVILETSRINFGAKPFRFFNSWLQKEDFDNLVEKAMDSYVKVGGRPDVVLANKFKHLRNIIKDWRNERCAKDKEDDIRDKEELEQLDKLCEERELSEEEVL